MAQNINIDTKKILLKAASYGRAFQGPEGETLEDDKDLTVEDRILVSYIMSVFSVRVKRAALEALPKVLRERAFQLEREANAHFDKMKQIQRGL